MTQVNELNNETIAGSETSVENHMAVGHKTGKGYLTAPGLHEFPVDYVVVDGLAIHEGCIELGTVEEVEAEAAQIRAAHLHQKTTEAGGSADDLVEPEQRGIGLPPTSSFLWTNGVVPYTIANDVPNPGRVDEGIRHIEEKTAIRFVKRTSSNARQYPNYIEIISNGNNSWSSSAIGMRGGRQVIRFSDRHSWPIFVHECCHALGIQHEQCRSDRDEFVEIRWDNIQDDSVGNFQKKPDSIDYFDYDYGSIMHYPGTSFAKDSSKPTIVPLRRGVTIGQRNGLSYGDRQTIAKIYERFFPRGYAGVWRAGTGRYGLWVNAEWSSFRNKWEEWSNQGLRLHDIHVRQVGNRTLYSGVFLPGTGRHALWANVEWNSFREKWQEWSSQGLRLVSLNTHLSGNQIRYSGAFLPGTGAHGLWANVEWDSFVAKWREWSAQGLRLVNLDVLRVGNQTRYSGAFLPGSGGHGLWANVEWDSFVAKWQEWSAQGLRLVDLDMHQVGNSLRYSGVFLPGNDGHYLWANVSYESFIAKWQELAERGLRLVNFEVADIASRTADVADAVPGINLGSDEVADMHEEPKEFGGIFGEEPVSQPMASSPVQEDGGGGIGGADAPSSEVESLNTETYGGLFFPGPDTESNNEQKEFGGAFFEGSPNLSSNGLENLEEVVL
ncbi:MAG: hypothetical protein Kow00121_43350 [Elainellaceae cyanobacterium]